MAKSIDILNYIHFNDRKNANEVNVLHLAVSLYESFFFFKNENYYKWILESYNSLVSFRVLRKKNIMKLEMILFKILLEITKLS